MAKKRDDSTAGLYVAEIELDAPAGEGLYTWSVKGNAEGSPALEFGSSMLPNA